MLNSLKNNEKINKTKCWFFEIINKIDRFNQIHQGKKKEDSSK